MNFLSQLKPRRFHSATTPFVLAEGNEDNDLWALVHEINDEILGNSMAITSVFVPTSEQRKAIANGENIALTCIGGQPPVMLRLTDEPIGKPPSADPDLTPDPADPR